VSVNRYKKYLTIFIVINDDIFAICRLSFNSIRRQPYFSRKRRLSPKKTKRRDALERFKVLRFAAGYTPMTNPLRMQLPTEEIFEVRHPGKQPES